MHWKCNSQHSSIGRWHLQDVDGGINVVIMGMGSLSQEQSVSSRRTHLALFILFHVLIYHVIIRYQESIVAPQHLPQNSRTSRQMKCSLWTVVIRQGGDAFFFLTWRHLAIYVIHGSYIMISLNVNLVTVENEIKILNQSWCLLSSEKWIKKMWSFSIVESYSATKNNEIWSFPANDIEWNKSNTERQILQVLAYTWAQKNWEKNKHLCSSTSLLMVL